MHSKRYDVIVIGAGASGMMCAAQAGQRGRRVLLIDHAEKLAEKIRISGGGRCNFTNRDVTAANYLSRNPHFCRSALSRYTQHDFLALVERHGIRYEEREHGQLFCEESAQDIIEMLAKGCADGRVDWAMPCSVNSIRRTGEEGERFELETSRGNFTCQSLVIATGGLSIPKIGATPFGYKVAEQFGLPVVQPLPALVPLTLQPEMLEQTAELAGAFFDAVATCGKTRFRENVLITHRGLSGPAILQISSYWQAQAYEPDTPKKPILIDLFPGEDAAAWLAGHARSKALLSNVLAERLPKRFAQTLCERMGGDRPANQFGQKELARIAEQLNGWALMPGGTLGYAKAEVTLGGVDTRALSSKTMEARDVPGLYFIGEVTDVTGHLGGYNFQWAWSSGWVAGQHA